MSEEKELSESWQKRAAKAEVEVKGETYRLFVDPDKLDLLNPYDSRLKLAEAAEISRNQIKYLIRGRGRLTTVAHLAAVMGVHPTDILVGEGYAAPKAKALVFQPETC